MSEEKEQLPVIKIGKWKDVICPRENCGLHLNVQTLLTPNYDIKGSTLRVWCRNCQRWIKFRVE